MKIDLTVLVDRQGHSPLSYAVYKEKAAAARVLLEHVRYVEGGGSGNVVLDSSMGDGEKVQVSPRSVNPRMQLSLAEWIN